MNDIDLKNPDVFSGELHFALLSEGLRGPMLRRLMRVSRTDAELGRIFETKVGEFRRYLRTSRRPTVWNLPTRAIEWVSDNVKVTPPREVFMTLVYVVLTLMVVELAKRQMSPAESAGDLTYSHPSSFDAAYGFPRATSRGSVAVESSRVDAWMIKELQRASQSEAWRAALARQLAASLEAVDAADVLRSSTDPPPEPVEPSATIETNDRPLPQDGNNLGEPVAASAAKVTTGAAGP